MKTYLRACTKSAAMASLTLVYLGCSFATHVGPLAGHTIDEVQKAPKVQAFTSPRVVSVQQGRFYRDGKPYYFMGANLWSGMNLGLADTAWFPGTRGDRARLARELDELNRLGIKNLRILATSQGDDSDPWQVIPTVENGPGRVREEVLVGLDFLMSEMGKRDMTAVVVLNNFWPWSGGMAQYVKWVTGKNIPYPPPAAGGDWYKYEVYTAQFYSLPRAVSLSNEMIRKVVTRTNTITGQKYSQDPAILSWELANEPRGTKNETAFANWINDTAQFIKSMDPNHMVTPGIEGVTPAPDVSKAIDYLTIHIWAQNFGWYNPKTPEVGYTSSVQKMTDYFNQHLAEARELNLPLVLEEFGLARDYEAYDRTSLTTYRNRYFTEVFDLVFQAAIRSQGMMGVNFWAWSGEALPKNPGGMWSSGDPFVGDPPHEPQGWYSVYKTDLNTLDIIKTYAKKLSDLK